MKPQFEGKYSAFPGTERRSVERLDSLCHDVELLRASLPLLSPKRLILLMVLSIFLAEGLIMFLLASVPSVPTTLGAFIDSAALLIILSPTFYFFHYRPLMAHHEGRREIIDQLCHSEERLNLALNAVNDGLWDWNIPTGEVYTSARATAMLGFEPDELGNRVDAWGKLLHPSDSRTVDKLLTEHLKGKSEYYRVEHRLRTKKGDYIWVLARGQVVTQSADGWPLRMIGTYTDITLRREAEDALRRSEEDIRTLSRTLMHSSEEEKKHLAQDLHDEFGQVLCAFQLGVEMLRDHNYGTPDQYEAQCDRLLSLVERLEVDLRHMCDHLRPVILDDLGLVPALKWHIDQVALKSPEVKTSFTSVDLRGPLSHEREIALYRICQEALNNVSKYAEADRVDVALDLKGNQLEMSIHDNGIGFNEEVMRRKPGGWGLGLLGMRERAAAVEGSMLIDSAPGEGTRIKVVVPLDDVNTEHSEEVCA